MSYLKVRMSQDVLDLLKIYYSSKYEVGGILFGFKYDNLIEILALSYKRGSSSKISFSENDYHLFNTPRGMQVVGTWHTHISFILPQPSVIDFRQWMIWDSDLVHLIHTSNSFSVFDCNGKPIDTKIKGATNRENVY